MCIYIYEHTFEIPVRMWMGTSVLSRECSFLFIKMEILMVTNTRL